MSDHIADAPNVTVRRRTANLVSFVVFGAFIASLAAPWKWY